MDEINVIEEKFTRCPRCRRFSVKQSDLNFLEKIKTHFFSVSAYSCENCSYRFMESGKFSIKFKKNWLVVVVPIVLVAILVAVLLLPGGQKKERQWEEESKINETTKKETEETEKPVQKKEVEEVHEVEIAGDVIIGNRNWFGVNWTPVENGIRITRLSNGPMKKAGLQLDDVLLEVDGQQITDGNHLLKVRYEIFNEERDEAHIKINRNNQSLYYKLIKRKKETSNQTAETVPITPNTTVSIKVFPASYIKIRKSAPDTVSAENKWCFLKKRINVKREEHQHVYVAGDSTGTQKWAVDDQLIVNSKAYNGLSGTFNNTSGYLPEEAKCQPLDITDMVPPDREITLEIELADHGIFWANTDIYIVVK